MLKRAEEYRAAHAVQTECQAAVNLAWLSVSTDHQGWSRACANLKVANLALAAATEALQDAASGAQ